MFKFLVLLLCLAAPLGSVAAQDAYRLNPGDELMISVWKEPDLKQQTLVLPDGTVSFPLVGQLNAVGRTPQGLQDSIAKKLRKYVPDAVVSVSVLKASGHKIYVTGEVNKPGEYQPSRSIDVMQALSLAGGLTTFASENRIIVLRRNGDQEMSLPFPYAEIQRGRELDKNFQLRSGDVVVVPGRSLF